MPFDPRRIYVVAALLVCFSQHAPPHFALAQSRPASPAKSARPKANPNAAARFYRQAQAALEATNYSQAITLLKQAVALDAKNTEYQTALADAHFGRAEKLEPLSKREEAIREYQEAYAIDKIHRRRDAALDLTKIGSAYWILSQYEKALEYYAQALTIRREIKDRRGEATMLGSIGAAYDSLSQYEKALEHYAQALPVYREIEDRSGEAVMLISIGAAYDYLSQFEKALEYYAQALPVYREIEDRESEAVMLNSIGAAYGSLSQYEKALEYYAQALPIRREIKDRRGEATTLNSIGQAYSNLSQYEKALEYYAQALTISREIKNRHGEAAMFNNIGQAYGSLSQYEKELEYYAQALPIQREIKHRRGEATTLNNIGQAYGSLSQYKKALRYYAQALTIRREVKDRPGEAATLNNIGGAYHRLSQYEKALEYYAQALTISREIKNQYGEATTLNSIGLVYGMLSQHEKALQYFAQALLMQREIKNRSGEATTLHNLMKIWKIQQQSGLAIFYGKQAVNVYQSIRADIGGLDKELQQGYLKSNEATYRQLADLLIEQGRLPEAQQVLGMLKAEEYFEFVRRDEKAAPEESQATLNSLESDWQKRYAVIADNITAVGAEYGRLDASRPSTAAAKDARKTRLLALQGDLDVAKKSFDAFFVEVKAAFTKRGEANAQVLNLPETTAMQETLRKLDRKAVVLYTIVGEDDLSVMLLTADALVARKNPQPVPRATVRKLVSEFLTALKNPHLDPRPAGGALYKVLFCDGQIARDLEPMRGADKAAPVVMWSLDDALRYVPMSALWDGKEYLVERYAQSVFTLGSRDGLREAPQSKWTALGLGVTKAHAKFAALPGVLGELRAVVSDPADTKSSGPLQGEILPDEKFTEQSFEAALLDHPPLVHIASHFQFKPGTEADSFLLLGDGKPLTLDKIRALRFSGVDLLTLSACDTATSGVDATGKEIEGFGVLAQRGGAGAVLASLWPVSDSSTSQLMGSFYAAREANGGKSKAEALRLAQLSLLQGKHFSLAGLKRGVTREAEDGEAPAFVPDVDAPQSHPYFWAPFILIGNWR